MKLHAQNIAVMAGASNDMVDVISRRLVEGGKIDVIEAKKIIANLQLGSGPASKAKLWMKQKK